MQINQPTGIPTNKVTAAGIGGALTIIIVYVANLAGLTIPPEVASAFTTIVAFISGYLIKEDIF